MDKDKRNITYNKALKFIYMFCGGFGFVAYVSYLIKLVFWPSNKIELIAAFLGIAVAGIPVFFRRFFERKLPKKLFKVLENIFAYCVSGGHLPPLHHYKKISGICQG